MNSLTTLISKIIERVVKSRLSDHLTSNNLVNPHQSAYCKHHSTETGLLYIHDHVINAIGSRKISFFCLVDLSAAFDTIDHISYSLICPHDKTHCHPLGGKTAAALSGRAFYTTCSLITERQCNGLGGVCGLECI